MAFLARLLPLAERLQHRLDGREQEVRGGEDEVDLGIGGHRRLEPGKRNLRVPLGRDFDRRLEQVRMRGDRVHEAGAALHRVGIGEVAHQDQRLQLLAGGVELLLRFGDHGVDRGARHRLVVGDDDDALAHIRRRPVEGRDRHVRFLRLGNDHGARVAVVGGEDDAVAALCDAVADLLELAVGVVPAIELDDLDAGRLQRFDDGAVTGDPEAGREILEGVADGLAFLCQRRRRRRRQA